MKWRPTFVVLFLAAALTGCGNGGDDGATDTGQTHGSDVGGDDGMVDAGHDTGATASDGGGGEDVLVIGDVGDPNMYMQRCDGKMADEWPFHDVASDANVTVTDQGDYFEATIDAAAGGISNAMNNPFVYVDLDANDKVDIDDFGSWENSDWDLAFKRTIIRTNSGDSGPGGVSVAKVSNTTFADVDSAPVNDSAYQTDVSLDDNCQVVTDPIGQPVTAFNLLNPNNPTGSMSWYSYGNGSVSPDPGDVYVVRTSEGATFKLAITDWQNGTYTIDWAELQ